MNTSRKRHISHTFMSHLPLSSLDDPDAAMYNPYNQNAQRRKRQRRLRYVGSTLALLCGTAVLFGDTLQGRDGLPSPWSLSTLFGFLDTSDNVVKRSLRAVEDNVRQSRRVLRDTVAWKRVPRMMLATDLAALAAEEEEAKADVTDEDVNAETGTDVADADKAEEGVVAGISEHTHPANPYIESQTIRPIRKRRMAVVRPFGPNNAAELEESFRLWDTHWPCSAHHLTSSEHSDEFQIDLYLLFSRTFDPTVHPEAIALATELQNKFTSNNGWNGCFSRLFKFEADIVPTDDNYDKSVHSGFNKDGESLEHRDIMWVNGPNESFRKVMTVLGGLDGRTIDGILGETDAEGSQAARNADAEAPAAANLPEVDGYELVSIMEPDVRPRRAGWLDDIIDEIHAKEPFAVLGR